MLNRSSVDRPSSSRSKRASLRNSLPLDDGQYFLYEPGAPPMLYGGQRPPSMHSQHHPHQFSTFPPVETDLDEPPSARHMVDAATLLTAPNEIMYASAGAERLGTTPPMSTEEEEEEDDEEAAALYSGAHLMTDDERFALAASEDDYMHMGGESGGGDGRHRQVGIYGWRKKVTYLLLSVIVLLVVVNAVLTYWIISFLGLSSNGIAGLDLSREDQMVFKGNAIFERALFASEIGSYQQQWLRFVQRNGDITFRSTYYDPVEAEAGSLSNETTTITTTEASASKRIDSKLTIGRGKVLVETDNFELYDRQRRLVFALNTVEPRAEKLPNSNETISDSHQMTILVDSLNVKSLNSIRLPLALQTPKLESGSSAELKIFSPQGRLLFRGPSSVAIESKLGDASMITFDELKLQSNQGKIVLESAQGIFMRKLSTAQLSNETNTPSSIIQRLRKPKVYQLCICQNGKLFLVAPDQKCAVQSNRDCL